jgi:hypothetical protein
MHCGRSKLRSQRSGQRTFAPYVVPLSPASEPDAELYAEKEAAPYPARIHFPYHDFDCADLQIRPGKEGWISCSEVYAPLMDLLSLVKARRDAVLSTSTRGRKRRSAG